MPDTPGSWRERLVAASPALPSLPAVPPRLAAAAMGAAGLVVGVCVALLVVRGAPPAPELSLPRAGVPATGAQPSSSGAAAGSPAGAQAEAEAHAYVHAAGAVARPGVYRVRHGGRVADVVDAAGGAAPDADLDQVNLAAKVTDGERVYLPRRGEAPAPGTSATSGGSGGGGPPSPIDLNTATLDQLDALPGVGPATAQAIVDYRREHGRFARVDELLEVRGIGQAKLAAIRSKVRV